MKCMFRYLPMQNPFFTNNNNLDPTDYDFECSEKALPGINFCKLHAEGLGLKDATGKEIVLESYTLADYVNEKESACVTNSAHCGPFVRAPEGAAMCTQCGEIIK